MILLVAAALVGVWGSERTVDPAPRGDLTIRRDGWTASLAGFIVPVQVQGNAIDFQLPAGQGWFRGALRGGRIEGHFVQPRAPAADTAYATPVVLEPLGARAWRGRVEPLEQTFAMYLVVEEGSGGVLPAVLHNSELNLTRRRPLTVEVEGDRVRLLDRGKDFLHGQIEGDRLILGPDPVDGGSVVLSRRTRDSAVGLYARTPEAPVVLRPPLAGNDGWRTTAPDAAGLDGGRLSAMVERISQPSSPPVHGVLIARHGKLAFEEYFHGYTADRLHDLRSAGKTFGTTLVGIAGIDVRAPLASFFPEVALGPEKAAITVEHALTMSTGLACDDDDPESPGEENRMQGTADWYRHILELPVLHPAGTFAAYCSGTVNLLGGVVRHATGAWLVDLFADRIARPLQFGRYAVNLGHNGDMYFAGGLRLRPRDFLKLGQTFLAGGVWNGRRVVPEAWVRAATQPHARLNNGSTDGYNWWIQEIGGARTYNAGGNGGQFVYVVPDRDLVVAFTGGGYGQFGLMHGFAEQLLAQFVLPAASP